MIPSGWEYNQRYRELEAAHRWGFHSPDDYGKLPKSSRIEILAWYEANWRIQAINSYEAQKQAERESKRKAKKK